MDFRDIKEYSSDIIKYTVIIILVLLIMTYVVSLQQVVGKSMEPKYKNADMLVLNKLNYKISNPKRFDIVVMTYADSKYLVKRIIGMPGERIEYINNALYVNGREIEEKFLKDTKTDNFKLYETIPKNYYLVLGDNREDSLDSRDERVGLVHKKDLVGKVLFRIWPIIR